MTTRFVPTIGSLLGGAVCLIAISEPHAFHWAALGFAALEGVAITLGYGVGLYALRRRLAPTPTLDDWRSASAALLALVVLGVLSIFTQGASSATIVVLSIAAGVLSAFLTWTPTLWRRQPPARTLEELEAQADAALAAWGEGDFLVKPTVGLEATL